MSKQTAVMYFINELKKSKDFQRVINEVNLSSTSVRDVIQETLQMELEQIQDAYVTGAYLECGKSKTYYEETYGGQDE
jgi:predicted transcriptional regulator